ncbi:MAG: hypothetical protein AAFU67_18960, partial [Bacteroidota bacterium]
LFRKLDEGLNPDLELVRFLSEQTSFKNSPVYAGSLSVGSFGDPGFINLGLMIGKIDNRGDAWQLFQELTEKYYTAILASPAPAEVPSFQPANNYDDINDTTKSLLARGTYEWAALLGQRTGEMHNALASSSPEFPDLKPEPLTANYRNEIFTGAKKLLDRQFAELSQKLAGLTGDQLIDAQAVLARRDEVEARLAAMRDRDIPIDMIRIHADYHLGQVLYNNSDFYIIDFEGEPLLSIPERRRKRPSFKDVAGMIRSFHYAAQGQLLLNPKYTDEERKMLTPWGELWFRHIRHAFLQNYMAVTAGTTFVPKDAVDREDLLDFFILEKAIYEVAYELNSRPTWLSIPLRGVLFALI